MTFVTRTISALRSIFLPLGLERVVLWLGIGLFSSAPTLAQYPLVSNISAKQRPGVKLVDITYDVTADTPTVFIFLEISDDGGQTFTVPAVNVSGAVGAGVVTGNGKLITWNAGLDWDDKLTPNARFRVVADDNQPNPSEFSWIAAGILGTQMVNAFYMAKTEVSWSEFQIVRMWATTNGYDIGSAGTGAGFYRPVTNVNWYSALKWCNARSEKEGLQPVYKLGNAIYRVGNTEPTVDTMANGYRLPSEPEWEFAARGGINTNGHAYSGSNDINAVAWYKSNSDGNTKDVATKQPNELGISDMSGNVWEWCFGYGQFKPRRGGSWNDGPVGVGGQTGTIPTSQDGSLGFRIARSSLR